MSELGVIAHLTVSAGNQEKVLPLLQLDDEREIVDLERYASQEAFAAHQGSPLKDIVLDQIIPLPNNRVIESYDATE